MDTIIVFPTLTPAYLAALRFDPTALISNPRLVRSRRNFIRIAMSTARMMQSGRSTFRFPIGTCMRVNLEALLTAFDCLEISSIYLVLMKSWSDTEQYN